MKLENLIRDLKPKLSEAAKKELDELLVHPEVVKIQERDEKALLKLRRDQLAELNGLHKRFAERKNAAERNCDEAVRRHEAAAQEYRDATFELHQARAAALAVDVEHDRIKMGLEKVLRESSDPRLVEFWRGLESVFQNMRLKSELIISYGGSQMRPIGFESNAPEIQEVMDLISAQKTTVNELSFAALTRGEVTSRLSEMSAQLAGVVAPFQVIVPTLDDDGKVVMKMMPTATAPTKKPQSLKERVFEAVGIRSPESVAAERAAWQASIAAATATVGIAENAGAANSTAESASEK